MRNTGNKKIKYEKQEKPIYIFDAYILPYPGNIVNTIGYLNMTITLFGGDLLKEEATHLALNLYLPCRSELDRHGT